MGRYEVMAVCQKCGGPFTLKSDRGAFSKAPLHRLWEYECGRCGRIVVSAAEIPSFLTLPDSVKEALA